MASQSATTLTKTKKVDKIDIVSHGDQLIIPDSISYTDAIKAIQQKMEYEEEVVALSIPIDGYFILDALLAFHKAIAKKFSWSSMVPTPGFFGPEPPVMRGIQVGLLDNGDPDIVQVPWGSIKIPHIDGRLETSVTKKDGKLIFMISGRVKRKHENSVQELILTTREFLRTESIYRSKAIRVRFRDDNGEELQLPEPKFLDLRGVKEDELIFSDDVMTAIRTNLFTPIEKSAVCRENGIPFKRGVLLAGPYGTGKTLAAYVTAKKAVDNGWTYIACDRADELADVLRFAQLYGPAVVFCEDIDRVMQGERSINGDEMLNLVDGIESKGSEIMVVFTTNEIDLIQKALLRPGRLDGVINVTPPDAKAAIKLMRMYGRNLIPEAEDLTRVGTLVQGNNAAAIREIVEKAKLYAISLQEDMDAPLTITAQALIDTANGMKMHLELLMPKEEDKRSIQEKAASILADAMNARTLSMKDYMGFRQIGSEDDEEVVLRSVVESGLGTLPKRK